MHREILDVKKFTVMVLIILEIEELDKRIQFPSEDFACQNLGDLIAITETLMLWRQGDHRASAARETVYAAAKKAFPSVDDPPDHLPILDVFDPQTARLLQRSS